MRDYQYIGISWTFANIGPLFDLHRSTSFLAFAWSLHCLSWPCRSPCVGEKNRSLLPLKNKSSCALAFIHSTTSLVRFVGATDRLNRFSGEAASWVMRCGAARFFWCDWDGLLPVSEDDPFGEFEVHVRRSIYTESVPWAECLNYTAEDVRPHAVVETPCSCT